MGVTCLGPSGTLVNACVLVGLGSHSVLQSCTPIHPSPCRYACTWAHMDHEACQKTCSTEGVDARRPHSDPSLHTRSMEAFQQRAAAAQAGLEGENKPRELQAELLCMSQAACKEKCTFSNSFIPVFCSIVKKLLIGLEPREIKVPTPSSPLCTIISSISLAGSKR